MNNKAYSEVYQLIQYLAENEYIRIPKEKIKFLEENLDKSAKKTYTITTNLEEIELSSEAKIIFMSLFYNYLANDEQKNKMKKILEINQEKEEQLKIEQYNPDDIFKKENRQKDINIAPLTNNTNTALIEYKKSFFTRFKNFIFKILHIKNK